MKIPAKTRGFMERGLETLLNLSDIEEVTIPEHTKNTPQRAVEALLEMMKGCWENPVDTLDALFDGKNFDEIIYMNDISFISLCEHHLLPFFGKVHFGYLPNEHIVGASKIPRLVECYACRPQIQEQLAQQIVDTFSTIVKPWGCGIIIEAWHLCVSVRGIKQRPAYMKTSALRGSFKEHPTRGEFLDGVRKTTENLWP